MGSEGRRLALVGAGESVKQVGVVLGLVFVVVLAVVVGKKMSAEAMAVVIGVVCGVVAAIPTSVLLLVVITRRDSLQSQRLEEMDAFGAHGSRGRVPPVVVIQGGAPQGLPAGPQGGYWPAPHPGPVGQRQFHVVGGNDLLPEDEGV
jgi:hypothetical protein